MTPLRTFHEFIDLYFSFHCFFTRYLFFTRSMRKQRFGPTQKKPREYEEYQGCPQQLKTIRQPVISARRKRQREEINGMEKNILIKCAMKHQLSKREDAYERTTG